MEFERARLRHPRFSTIRARSDSWATRPGKWIRGGSNISYMDYPSKSHEMLGSSVTLVEHDNLQEHFATKQPNSLVIVIKRSRQINKLF